MVPADDADPDEEVPFPLRRLLPPKLSPAQFETYVSELVVDMLSPVEADVRVLERIEGTDGAFVMDVSTRYRVGQFDHLFLVEAKMHGRPVDRSVLQVLHAKMLSTGAQKGAVFSTSGFQRGAIEFAGIHGIGLVQVTSVDIVIERRCAGFNSVVVPGDGGASAIWICGDESTIRSSVLSDAESARRAFSELTASK